MSDSTVAGSTPPRRLLRVAGLSFGIAAVIGGTIGGGILRTPGTIAGLLGEPWLILTVWIACGALVLISANSMAELAAALPRAGGPYEYCKMAYGRAAGFAIGWSDWITNSCALAFLSVATAEYALQMTSAPTAWTTPLAIALLFAIATLNWFGLRLGSRVQELLSFAKVAGLAFVVLACLYHVAQTGHSELGATGPSASAVSFGSLAAVAGAVRAMQLMYETYQGWNSGVYFAEEVRDEGRNVPRAMFIGIGVIIGIYVLINLAVLLVVPLPQLAQSKLAVADAANVVIGPAAGRTVTVLAFVSLLGILNVTLMFAPRVLFALGRDGLSVGAAGRVNAHGTPGLAMLITVALSALLALAGSFESLFEITGTIGMTVNALTMSALFRLRRTHPDLPRPYVAKGYPWLPAIALATTLTLVVAVCIATPATSVVAFGLLALCFPAYAVISRSQAQPADR